MSECFPLWITADTILTGEIAPRLGVYTSADPTERSVNVSFLPPYIIYLVPEEDRETFIRQYNLFQRWASDTLGLPGLLEPFLYGPICDATQAGIEWAVRWQTLEYTSNHEIGFQTKFLEFMGISPVCEHIFFELEYDHEALQAALKEETPEG